MKELDDFLKSPEYKKAVSLLTVEGKIHIEYETKTLSPEFVEKYGDKYGERYESPILPSRDGMTEREDLILRIIWFLFISKQYNWVQDQVVVGLKGLKSCIGFEEELFLYILENF